MVVGCYSGENYLNFCKNKKPANFRSAGASNPTPARKLILEAAPEYIGEDELVEITPEPIRLRRKVLKPGMRERAVRQS